MTLPRHIKKWWDIANFRRQRLIYKKHMGTGLTQAQEAEFQMLQKVAGAFIDYVSPLDLGPLEKRVQKAERLAKKILAALSVKKRSK